MPGTGFFSKLRSGSQSHTFRTDSGYNSTDILPPPNSPFTAASQRPATATDGHNKGFGPFSNGVAPWNHAAAQSQQDLTDPNAHPSPNGYLPGSLLSSGVNGNAQNGAPIPATINKKRFFSNNKLGNSGPHLFQNFSFGRRPSANEFIPSIPSNKAELVKVLQAIEIK